jgi:multisubunit Na+/H+ antiporter MnhB subunit
VAEQPPPTRPVRPWKAPQPESSKGPAAQVNELKDLVVAYAKQETLDPLRTLGRSLGLGLAGAVCIGVGAALALLALLRGLQEIPVFATFGQQTGDPYGRWSWAPYFITAVVGLVLVGLSVRSLVRATRRDTPGR